MAIILQAFTDIAFMRRGPQDIPASRFLFVLTLIGYVLMNLLHLGLRPADGWQEDLLLSVLDVVLLLFLFYLLLAVFRRSSRYLQTITALFGVNLLVTALQLPFYVWRQLINAGPDVITLPDMVLLALLVWFLAIVAHVTRHALEIPYVGAAVISIMYFVLFQTLAGLLVIPPP